MHTDGMASPGPHGQKRPRDRDEEDDDDDHGSPTRGPKIRRIAGMDIGPNLNDDASPWPPKEYMIGRRRRSPPPPSTIEGESSTEERLMWQDPNLFTYNDASGRMTHEQRARWLSSNMRWTRGLGSDWRGEKVLGAGGFGLVGVWEYTDQQGGQRRVVVKQSKGKNNSLKGESKILSRVAETRTRHVVRILKKYHEERGTGSSTWDPEGEWVSRIYLEYCQGGDFNNHIKAQNE